MVKKREGQDEEKELSETIKNHLYLLQEQIKEWYHWK
jgi:hypothetical protein